MTDMAIQPALLHFFEFHNLCVSVIGEPRALKTKSRKTGGCFIRGKEFSIYAYQTKKPIESFADQPRDPRVSDI